MKVSLSVTDLSLTTHSNARDITPVVYFAKPVADLASLTIITQKHRANSEKENCQSHILSDINTPVVYLQQFLSQRREKMARFVEKNCMKQSVKVNETSFLFDPQRLRMLLKYSIFTAEPESDYYDHSEILCHGPIQV